MTGMKGRASGKQQTQGRNTRAQSPNKSLRQQIPSHRSKQAQTKKVAGDRKGASQGGMQQPNKLLTSVDPTGNHKTMFRLDNKTVRTVAKATGARDQLLHRLPATGHEGVRNMTAS